MIPKEPSALERRRFVLLTLMRAGGVVIMLVGLALWFGGLMPNGERVGAALFAFGVAESLLLPALLASQWRTPPAP